MQLRELGALLERRRKERGLSRAELARRLGLSETYIYHVERAVPRAHGEPSQASRTVLERWGQILEWPSADTRHALALAGHEDPMKDPEGRRADASDSLAFAGVVASPTTVRERPVESEARPELASIDRQIAETIANYHLPRTLRRQAEAMIRALAETVCQQLQRQLPTDD